MLLSIGADSSRSSSELSEIASIEETPSPIRTFQPPRRRQAGRERNRKVSVGTSVPNDSWLRLCGNPIANQELTNRLYSVWGCIEAMPVFSIEGNETRVTYIGVSHDWDEIIVGHIGMRLFLCIFRIMILVNTS